MGRCKGETVVDLFAGIGYFTVPFLCQGGADHVHACEWNEFSIIALEENLRVNNVRNRCTIYHGDNRETMRGKSNFADR